jgi:NAD(P)-dependent dehydrogenase (short-subunit alcohol dehydrogenase family)
VPSVVLITCAATGIGNLTARARAATAHTVYAGMRDIRGRNADHGRCSTSADAKGGHPCRRTRRAVRRLGGRGRRDPLDALVARNEEATEALFPPGVDGADEVNEVPRRAQEQFVTRLGFGELLHVRGAVGTGPAGACTRTAS